MAEKHLDVSLWASLPHQSSNAQNYLFKITKTASPYLENGTKETLRSWPKVS